MNYAECLDYLYAKLPLFSKMGHAALKIDLSNTIAICRKLGNPEKKIKTIHVAGTNGKGSVSHMLAAVFQTAGYKTGLYTSPHLKDFRERIKIGGEMIPEEKVIRYTEMMMPVIEEISPSFFEVTVGMAFTYFADEQVDIAIIETGLGGRLDSTNIILPDVSIITNIGFDHEQILGNTLEKIAGEKAGIIKYETPVVIGRTTPETREVFLNKAEMENAKIYFADQDWNCEIIESQPHSLVLCITEKANNESMTIESELPGLYQHENIRTVLAAIKILCQKGWQIQPEDVCDGIRRVKTLTGLGGRWELLQKDPFVILDVAHNEDGIKNVIKQINSVKHSRLFIVLGMSKDKDVEKVIALLPKKATYCYTKAQIPRAMEISALEKIATEAGLNGSSYEHVNHAISACLKIAQKDDLIVVCGSIFVVGEVDRDEIFNN
ncbi:MAG: bifunctional folylpolyglutamate synthase/dihydrofolate synthase [bacterium]